MTEQAAASKRQANMVIKPLQANSDTIVNKQQLVRDKNMQLSFYKLNVIPS